MKAAICTSVDSSVSFPETIRLIRDAGFEVVALGARPQHSDYTTATGRKAIRKLLDENGLAVDSVHAPFPEGDRLFSLDENERNESIRQCCLAMEAAAELNGRIVVVHLIQPYDIPHGEMRDRMIEQGRRSVESLAGQAEKMRVGLALENGQREDYDQVLAGLLEEFDCPHVGFCYDSGHEHVQGACFSLLERFGHRLFTVHIHDNSGTDTHQLPYEGSIDWARFQQVFHRLPYDGNLLLEVDIANSRFKEMPAFLAEAKRCADQLLVK